MLAIHVEKFSSWGELTEEYHADVTTIATLAALLL